jgi:N-acyl-D-aspartate/D-glutamate deacylase
VVIDPATVGADDPTMRFDLPGGAGRLYAGSHGVEHVLVNGSPLVTDGELTVERPGALLRSGRDTADPSMG